MYTLVKLLGLSHETFSQWQDVNHNASRVSELFTSYKSLIAVILRTSDQKEFYIDMAQLKASHGDYENYLNILIPSLGDYAFVFLSSLPNEKVGYVHYEHAIRIGYKFKLAEAGYKLPVTSSRSPDLLISRPEISTDLSLLHKYCLMSVNGYYHMTETDGKDSWIVGGGDSCYHAEDNQIGVLSFLNIGKLHKVKITDEDISIPSGFLSLKDRVQIKIPETHVSKPYFLVLGGYLFFPKPEVLWKSGDTSLTLDIGRISFLERVLESRSSIDLSSLDLEPVDINESSIFIEQFWSDNTIRKYLQLKQSFIVFVETDHLFTGKVPIRKLKSPGLFAAYTEPKFPIIVGTGRTAEYWKRKEGDRWAITLVDSYRRRYVHHREKESNLTIVADQLDFQRPFFFSDGYLLEIGGYKNKE